MHVNECLRDMKKKDSKVRFNICTNLQLDSMPLLGEILAEIIIDSFESYYFPETLQQPTIVSIRMIPGTRKMEAFRPINTLPCIEKAIAKIACIQLKIYITDAEILCNEQSDCRIFYSCESALNYVLF